MRMKSIISFYCELNIVANDNSMTWFHHQAHNDESTWLITLWLMTNVLYDIYDEIISSTFELQDVFAV
jgi:hypothetical protein